MIEYKVRVYDDGAKEWSLNDQLHREDGPACEYSGGSKVWYLNGKLHREDGPAIEYDDGSKAWHLNDQLHREDGPAVEWSSGTKYWYLGGKEMTEQEHKKAMAKTTCEDKEVVVDGITPKEAKT